MKRFIKILKAIFSLGYTFYAEYKDKQKQIDSLVAGTQDIFDYINNIRRNVSNENKSLRDVFHDIDIGNLKDLASNAQIRFGTAKDLAERIKYLYDNDVIKTIDEIKSN